MKSITKTIVVIAIAAIAALALAGCVSVRVAGSGSASSASTDTSAGSATSTTSTGSSAASTTASSGAASTTSSSTSASTTSPSASSTSPAPASGDLQTIGNDKVGQMQVPKTWTDRSSDLQPGMIDSYSMVYYADPNTEYTSGVKAHFDFAESVQMSVRPTSYKDVAKTLMDKYNGDSNYSGTSSEEGTYNGRNAVVITTTSADGVNMLAIVIDRDGDGKAAVTLEMNCGTNQTQSQEVLAYASTWTI